jgi:hypothetical protein
MTDQTTLFPSDEDKRRKRAQSLVGTSKGRPADDFYATPRRVIEALLEVESFSGVVWEPACGDGAISRVLTEQGLPVISSDLYNRGFGVSGVDFLTPNDIVADHVITNPPFRYAQQFAEQALSRTNGKVALFLKLAFLEGKKRSVFLANSPLKRVWVFSARPKLSRNGDEDAYKAGGMIAFAWFVWDHSHEGEPTIGWL